MKKQLICATLFAASLIPTAAFAVEAEVPHALSDSQNSIIQPRYAQLQYAKPTLSVSGTKASYSLDARGASTVTKMSATLQLQKKESNGSYSNYGSSWSASSSGNKLTTDGSKTVDSGGTYRLKASITLYVGSSSSTEVVYS